MKRLFIAQTGENEDTRPRTQDIFRGLSNVYNEQGQYQILFKLQRR